MQTFLSVVSESLEAETAKPALFREVDMAPFRGLGVDFLDQALTEGRIRPDMISVVKGGKHRPAAEFSLRYREQGYSPPPVLNSGSLGRALEQGGTVEVKGCDHWIPDLALFTNTVRRAVERPVLAQMFFTPAGERGLPVHTDTFDVFVVQLEGEKSWTVYPRLDGPVHQRVFTSEELADPVVRCTVRQGDVLYVPAGCPHMAEARSTSLHLSIGIRSLSVADVLVNYLSQANELPALLQERLVHGSDIGTVLVQALESLMVSVQSSTHGDLAACVRGRDVGFWQKGGLRSLSSNRRSSGVLPDTFGEASSR